MTMHGKQVVYYGILNNWHLFTRGSSCPLGAAQQDVITGRLRLHAFWETENDDIFSNATSRNHLI